MKWSFKYCLLSFIALALSGCTVEQKLASSFVKSGISDEFIILKPDFLFKYNLKTYEVPGIDSLEESTKDSLLLANSLFLKDIDDNEIIDEFISSFIKTLKTYNVRSYPENYLDTFLAVGRKAVILNFAQFSLEEYVHPYSTEEFVDYEVIVIENIDLNALNYNIWLELSHLNSEGDQKVLFTSDYLLDNIDGTLKQYLFTGEMQFDYTIDTITPARIHKFASDFGKTTAGYLYDYYLNQYIGDNLPVDYGYERYYYHYDPKKPKPYPADPEDRFIELKK